MRPLRVGTLSVEHVECCQADVEDFLVLKRNFVCYSRGAGQHLRHRRIASSVGQRQRQTGRSENRYGLVHSHSCRSDQTQILLFHLCARPRRDYTKLPLGEKQFLQALATFDVGDLIDLPRGDVRSKGVFKQCSGSMRRRGGKGRGARPATCQEGADACIAVLVGLSGSALCLLRYGFAIASPRNDAIPNDSRDGYLPCEQ
jgi:hypothetical protein